VLYLQAAAWAFFGAALGVAPRFVLVTVFGQPPLAEFAWVRLFGIQTVALAMLMVIVAHRIEELWWWSWAFAFAAVFSSVVVVLNLGLGLEAGQSSWLWWAFSVVTLGFAMGLLYGLYVSSRERPVPWW
jgi:intracellular septation protein A